MWPSKEFTQEFTQHSHQENYIILVFPHSCHAKRILIWWNTWVLLLVVSLFVLPLTSQASNITEGGNSASDKHNEPNTYRDQNTTTRGGQLSPRISHSLSLFSHPRLSLHVTDFRAPSPNWNSGTWQRGNMAPGAVAWVPMWKWKRSEKLWQEEPAKRSWKEHMEGAHVFSPLDTFSVSPELRRERKEMHTDDRNRLNKGSREILIPSEPEKEHDAFWFTLVTLWG